MMYRLTVTLSWVKRLVDAGSEDLGLVDQAGVRGPI